MVACQAPAHLLSMFGSLFKVAIEQADLITLACPLVNVLNAGAFVSGVHTILCISACSPCHPTSHPTPESARLENVIEHPQVTHPWMGARTCI